jgi:hypothetical protein
MLNRLSNAFSGTALVVASLAAALHGEQASAELRVPAFTAYVDPDPEGARVRTASGISDWKGPGLQVLWFGELKVGGKLDCSLSLRLPPNATSRLQLTVAGQSHEVTAKGDGNSSLTVRLGSFDIDAVGYQRFTLTSLNQWIELTTAAFSCDPTGRADRLDRFMGLENGQFFLSHGGFIPGFTKPGEKFDRPAKGSAPSAVGLPEIPFE